MFPLSVNPRIRVSPYFDSTVEAGLNKVSVYNKMILPVGYGDFEAELDRLMNGVAIWDVGAERQVEVAGPGAASCVQYLTARDLSRQQTGQGYYVAMCDHSGRLLNDPVLLKLSDDRYWFSLADADMLLWCRAIAAERNFDVTVREPDVSPLAVQGPMAEDVVADLFGDHVRDLRYFWFIETQIDGIPLVLCRSGWSKQGGFELFLQDGSRGSDLWDLVMEAGSAYGIGPGAPNEVERVESGLLSFGGDSTPDSNPFEAGMARYVHTDTDVEYIGKSALRRIVDAGGPERLLVGLRFDAFDASWPVRSRTPVLAAGREVGTLSSVVNSRRLDETIGIAQIETSFVIDENTERQVEVSRPDGRVLRARIVELPFV